VSRLSHLLRRTRDALAAVAARSRERAIVERRRESEHVSRMFERLRQSISAETAERFRELREHVVAEANRLDGYVAYQIDRLGAEQRHIAARLARPRTVLQTAPGSMAVIDEDFTFVVPSEQIGLIQFLVRQGHAAIEPGLQRLIRERLRPGATAVDIGAGFGFHAVVMAQAVGREGRVFCFEPNAGMASALQQTLVANGFADRAILRTEALSASGGSYDSPAMPHGPLGKFFVLPQPIDAPSASVPVIRLDEALAPGAPVDFVRIGAGDGAPVVYRGMTRLVAENPRLELVMAWARPHRPGAAGDAEAFHRQLRQDGFRAFRIEDSGDGYMRPVSDQDARMLEGATLHFTRRSDAS